MGADVIANLMARACQCISKWSLFSSGGGHVEAIKFLLERGADPNKRGQFMRSPLYRAAFAGHLEACEVRMYDSVYNF